MQTPSQPNTLGNASLGLGLASAALVFGLGLCTLVGVQQGTWIRAAATPLFVCGASSAFLGLLGAGVGAAGLFGKNRPKATAVAGWRWACWGCACSLASWRGCAGAARTPQRATARLRTAQPGGRSNRGESA